MTVLYVKVGVQNIVVYLNKADAVDDKETLELVRLLSTCKTFTRQSTSL